MDRRVMLLCFRKGTMDLA